MKADSHLKKAREIKASVAKLKDDPVHLVAVVELCYGMAQQFIAYGLEDKYGEHRDTHTGLPALLRENDRGDIAMQFERLDTLRHGRWYGGKGNGEVLDEALDIISKIERWATE
ncbi:MAG: hypothetical protein KAS67_06600 [Thermoplasmata archaeon]|nr:hypothetical protein [Thermoplasmata archaeon]